MLRGALVLAAYGALSGCATPVGLSLLGGGASAVVSHGINGTVTHTFSAPAAQVRTACVRALGTMGAVMDSGEGSGDALLAHAGERAIRIEFERLGASLTLVKVTVSRADLLRDSATAAEVVAQTEKALATPGAKPATLASARANDIPPAAADPAIGLPAAPTETYVVTLASTPPERPRRVTRLPARLRDYAVYQVESERGGRRMIDLNLGYFASEAQAQTARRIMRASFPSARVVRLDPPPTISASRGAESVPAL